MLVVNNSQLTSLPFQRLIVSTICTSANPRGFTKAGPTSTTSSSKASSLPKAPARKSSAPPAPPALVPMPRCSPWHSNSPPLCPAKPTSSTLPRRTASGRISSPKVQSAAPPSLPADAAHPPAANSHLLAVHVDQVRTEESREAGPVHAGYQFWQRLGLDAILAQAGLSERVRQLSCAMTLNRLIHPASELATPDWIRSTALPDILQVDFQLLAEDALYRNLDRLHAQRVVIEAALAERERTLFGLDQTLFLYDVTSTYFEGRALANPKAKRGYSRDHRPDCKQVLIGLAVNRDGFPLAHEVLAGN